MPIAAAVVGGLVTAGASAALNSGAGSSAGGLSAGAQDLSQTQANIAKQQFQFWQQYYQPLEAQMVPQVQQLTTAPFMEQQAGQAGATTAAAYDAARQNLNRAAFSSGLAPNSGPYAAQLGNLASQQAAQTGQAETQARWNALMQGLGAQQNTSALGRGLPMSSMQGLSSAANTQAGLANAAWNRYYTNVGAAGYALGPLGQAAGQGIVGAANNWFGGATGTPGNYATSMPGTDYMTQLSYANAGAPSTPTPMLGSAPVNTANAAGFSEGGGIERAVHRDPGGGIHGPGDGSGEDDAVPARMGDGTEVALTDGEHVMNVHAVKMLGRGFLDAANKIALMRKYDEDQQDEGQASGGPAIASVVHEADFPRAQPVDLIGEGGESAQPVDIAQGEAGGLARYADVGQGEVTNPPAQPAQMAGPDDSMRFGEAFAAARQSGMKTFGWRGRKYTTQLASAQGAAPAPKWPTMPDGEIVVDGADHLPYAQAFAMARASNMPTFQWRGRTFNTKRALADGGRGSVYASDLAGIAKKPIIGLTTSSGEPVYQRDFGPASGGTSAGPASGASPLERRFQGTSNAGMTQAVEDRALEQAARIGEGDQESATVIPFRPKGIEGVPLEESSAKSMGRGTASGLQRATLRPAAIGTGGPELSASYTTREGLPRTVTVPEDVPDIRVQVGGLRGVFARDPDEERAGRMRKGGRAHGLELVHGRRRTR